MQVKISKEEFSILKQAVEHYEKLIKFKSQEIKENVYFIFAEEDAYDNLREACLEYLLFNGFDKDYNTNSKNLILERLIDKFFTE